MANSLIKVMTMNGKIRMDGRICIERSGTMKGSRCPFQEGNYSIFCGDWCVLFGEP